MGALVNTTTTLAANVAQGGTLVLPAYPAGSTQASLNNSVGGKIVDTSTQQTYNQGAGGFTVVFGASTITITNDSGQTWLAGAELRISFGRNDINGSYNLTFPKQLQDKVATL